MNISWCMLWIVTWVMRYGGAAWAHPCSDWVSYWWWGLCFYNAWKKILCMSIHMYRSQKSNKSLKKLLYWLEIIFLFLVWFFQMYKVNYIDQLTNQIFLTFIHVQLLSCYFNSLNAYLLVKIKVEIAFL